MNRRNLHRATAALSVLSAAAPLRVPGYPTAVAGVLAVVALWRIGLAPDGRAALSRRAQGVLAGVAALLGFAILHRLSGSGPSALAELLAMLAVLQTLVLVRAQSQSTAVALVLLSTTSVAGAAFLRADAGALALTLLHVMALLGTLFLLERASTEDRVSRAPGTWTQVSIADGHARPKRRAMTDLARLFAVGLTVAAVVYVFAPRAWFESDPGDDDTAAREGARADDPLVAAELDGERSAAGRLTGPGRRGVRLGDIGRIKRDLTPFFEVELPPGRAPRLREDTADTYEGGDWSSAPVEGPSIEGWVDPGRDGWTALEPAPQGEPPFTTRVTLLRGNVHRLYLEPVPARLRILRDGPAVIDSLYRHDNEQIRCDVKLNAQDVVECVSVPPRLGQEARMAAPSDAIVSPRSSYLQLPEAIAEEMRTLAEGVVGEETNPWQRALTLEAWLKGADFAYTLQMPDVDTKRPTLDFLQESRRVHCEYFASSLTLLLRSLGHPARLVRGFRGGDWQPGRGKWLVRGSHYHAWTEMYLGGIGWVSLDATPPDREARDADTVTGAAPVVPGREGSQGAGVLGWSDEDRRAFFAGVGRFLERYVVTPLRALLRIPGGRIALPALAVLLLVMLVRRVRGRRERAATGRGRTLPEGPYGDALVLWARDGVRRARSQTAREFLRAAVRSVPEARAPFLRLTRAYEAERFGAQACREDAVSALQELRGVLDRRRAAQP